MESVTGVQLDHVKAGKARHYAFSGDKAEKQLCETLVDMFFFTKAHVFVPSLKSGLSRWALQMLSKNESDIFRNIL